MAKKIEVRGDSEEFIKKSKEVADSIFGQAYSSPFPGIEPFEGLLHYLYRIEGKGDVRGWGK